MKEEEKKKQDSFFSTLGNFMKPHAAKYTASVLISTASVLLSICSYAFVGAVGVNLFVDNPQWNEIILWLALAVLAKIGNGILLNTSTWISHKAAYGTLKDIRLALTDKMLRLPMGYFEENGSGRLKTMLVDRVESMEKTLAHMIPELTANLLAPMACSVWMFFVDWRLALCALGWIVLGFSVTGGMMHGYEAKFAGQIAKMKSMNQAVVEYVNGIEVIKNFGRTDDVYGKYKTAVNDHAEYNVKWQKESQVYMALGMAIAPFSLFPVLIFGLLFFGQGTITAGALFMMVILTFSVFGPLMNAMNYFDQLAGMGTNAKEIRDVLDYPEVQSGALTEAEDSSVEFKNVSFSYRKDNVPVIENISFLAEPGKMFALVGPSGSGKSTIAKLIGGYWDADSGEILIGKHNIQEYSREALNRLVAFVDQDTFLFDKSIADNIRLARPDASMDDVIAASKRSGCHEFISRLPHGYDTVAGEAGNFLSGGEKQRIAIVRAMMKDAPIMVLDEATAATDPENEASVQQALLAASKNKTLIVVAHRLYTVRNAEQIAFVKGGTIQIIGTHEQLLAKNSEYKRLWELSEGENDD